MNEIHWMTAAELSASYASGDLSPVEAAHAVLARIDTVDPVLNAFCHREDETVLGFARAAEDRWRVGEPLSPLDGVPVSVKDLMHLEGWPTRQGSRITSDAPSPSDHPAVGFLRLAGCVFTGKVTTPEFGNSGVTDSPLTGLTVNPWDTGRTPGGSSGGSVAAVAAGCGPLSLGSDGGGSIRTPCSFTNTVGLKPTFGRVPQPPGEHFGRLAVSGPIARTVRDAAMMMNAMARHWPGDWHSLADDGCDYLDGLDDGVRGLKVAYSADLGFTWCDPEILEGCARAAEIFRGLGADVEEADPGFPAPEKWFHVLWHTLAAETVLGMDKALLAKLGPEMRASAETGAAVPLERFFEARRMRTDMLRTMNAFHETYDLIVTPAAAVLPFATGHEAPPDWPGEDDNFETYAMIFNATGQPAVSVPCGFSRSGLPYGLQIAGRRGEDALVLRAARAFEAANPLCDRRPDLA